MRIITSTAAVVFAVLILGVAQPAYAQENNNNSSDDMPTYVEEVEIERGDTLTAIANDHETTYVRLYNANEEIDHPDVIFPGDKVKIPHEDADFDERELPADAVVPAPQPAAALSRNTTPTPAPKPQLQAITGGPQKWLSKSNIPASDHSYADAIISRESGWRHTIWNTTGSGAYGLCQSLPASKMASAGSDYMTNPVTQLNWCHSYAQARYGGWVAAYSFWQTNHWW
jgi:hypothetical protein